MSRTSMAATEDIHALFARVREHRDFAGGAIFTREDVAFALSAGHADPTPAQLASVTAEMRAYAEEILGHYIFASPDRWREALRHYLAV